MNADVITLLFDNLSFFLLLFALSIFGYLAFAAKSIRKFQFQFSIFIIIWIISEIVNLMPQSWFGNISEYNLFGLQIHLASMLFFGLLIWIRYLSAKGENKKILDNIEESLR